jgi:hypothetical protein
MKREATKNDTKNGETDVMASHLKHMSDYNLKHRSRFNRKQRLSRQRPVPPHRTSLWVRLQPLKGLKQRVYWMS